MTDMWKTILFDVDGTLTASGEGIKKSVIYALEKMGKPVPEDAVLEEFIGPPLDESFVRYTGMLPEEAKRAVEIFRERYHVRGVYENRPYDGIRECLSTLREAGFNLAIASSKPKILVDRVLEYFDLQKFFSVVVGAELDGSLCRKNEVIAEALKELGAEDKRDEIVYVGDRKYDVIGAHMNGLAVIGALYGYGSFEELSAEGPELIAASPSMLLDLIMERLADEQKESLRGSGRADGSESFNELSSVPVRENVLLKIWRVLYPILLDAAIRYAVLFLLGVLVVGVLSFFSSFIYESFPGLAVLGYYDFAMLIDAVGLAVSMPFMYIFFKRDEARREARPIPQGKMLPAKDRNLNLKLVTLQYVVFFLLAAQAVNFFLAVSGISSIDTAYQNSETMLSSPMLLIQILDVCLIGPVCEEMVFRLLVYRRIRDYSSVRVAVILSAALFGVYHMNFVQGIFAFSLGIFLAVFYEKTGDLRVPIAAHIANNIYSTVVDYFFTDAVIIHSVLFYIICTILTVTGGILLFRKKKKNTASA